VQPSKRLYEGAHLIDRFKVIMRASVAPADQRFPAKHPDLLLLTKLLPPPTAVIPIARPQLIHRLEQATATSLALIVAPAGYGKTTLLSARGSPPSRACSIAMQRAS